MSPQCVCVCARVEVGVNIATVCACVCARVRACVFFIELHVTAQSGPVILVIVCHSH